MKLFLFAAACAFAVHVAAQSPTEPFNFEYSTAGDRNLAPLNVFDDGSTTYLQFRSGVSEPQVFAEVKGRREHLPTERRGPYLTVPRVAARLVIVTPETKRIATVTANRPIARGVGVDTTGAPPRLGADDAPVREARLRQGADDAAPFLLASYAPPTRNFLAGQSNAAQGDIAALRQQVARLQATMESLMRQGNTSPTGAAAAIQAHPLPPAPTASPSSGVAQHHHVAALGALPAGILAPVKRDDAAVSASTPVAAITAMPGSHVASSAPRVDLPTGAREVDARAPSLEFRVYSEERLSAAVSRFVAKLGYEMDWDPASGDFVVTKGFTLADAEMQPVLRRVLSHFGLSATIKSGNKIVWVSRG